MARRIVFHCGSAKAGSTTIQNQLWASRRILQENGYYYCPRFVRSGNVDPLNTAVRDVRLRNLRQAIQLGRSRLQDLFADGHIHTVILSNESGFGDPLHDREEGFFPFLERGIEGVANIFDGYDVQVCFVLRSQASLLPSFYMQRVRQGSSFLAEDYYQRALGLNLSWVPVVERIKAAFPRTTVCAFEALLGAQKPMAAALLGEIVPDGVFRDVGQISKNRAASARAVAVMRSLNRMAERLEKISGLSSTSLKSSMRYALYGRLEHLIGGPKLSLPFEGRETLEALYQKDKTLLNVT